MIISRLNRRERRRLKSLQQQPVPKPLPHRFRHFASPVAKADSLSLMALGLGILQSSTALATPAFTLIALDYNDGATMVQGFQQLATPGGAVDLRAQVIDSATGTYTYSWNTSGLNDASGISGTATYDLTFHWGTMVSTATSSSATLTVTDPNNNVVTQTYTFWVPAGTGSTTGGATWNNTTLDPGLLRPDAPVIASHNVSVVANTGALETSIALPSVNPNVVPVVLNYNSLSANALLIVIAEHVLDSTKTTPSQVSAQLTFNGTAGSTYYYKSSSFNPGSIMQIGQQATATSISSGGYPFTMTIADIRSSNTTFTYASTAQVINEAQDVTFKALGAGWTVAGVSKIITEGTSGVLLDAGNGVGLFFSGNPGTGSNYTSPAGEFSTLTKTATGWTRTLTNDTEINYNSSGYQTTVVDRNGNTTTYAYTSNLLTSVTDPYNEITTFTYASSLLSSIEDSAGRFTTFTLSSGNLTAVEYPDTNTWNYSYDGSARMTSVKDANSNITTIAYDSAERVGTITRPDSTTEEFSAAQEQGWTNSGTSGSPATAWLQGQVGTVYTDPRSNKTVMAPDWRGMGYTNQTTDPFSNVAVVDRDVNGLATIAVDPLNNITQRAYDVDGNVTQIIYADLNTTKFGTYNIFAEPASMTNENGYTTTYSYDSNGDLTVIHDALGDLTTMTYTTTGQVSTYKDANGNVTSYQYDSDDRRTTITFANSTTNTFTYDNQGDVTQSADGRGNVTTHSYDAMDRLTGTTDALSDITTLAYDSVGNLTTMMAPLSRTTTYAYDTMSRQTTITDPLGHITSMAYDHSGNLVTLTNALGEATNYGYDALNRKVTITDPMGFWTTYTYDAGSERLTVTDPLIYTTTTTYTNRGWVNTVTDPLGHISTYTYTATGQVASRADAPPGGSGSSTTAYTYDKLDRVIALTDPLSHTTSTAYDAVGNKISSTDALGNITTYSYDTMNRLGTVTDPLSHTMTYGYDNSNNRQAAADALGNVTTTLYDALDRATTIIQPGRNGTTTIAFDAAGRQTTLTDAVGNITTWAYDAADRLTTLTDPLGKVATYVYDNANELTDTTDRNSRRTTYSYDNDGRKTGETWVSASPAELITYTYDHDSRLTALTDANAKLTYTYDADGNRLTAVTSGSGTGQPTATLTYAYNPSNLIGTLTDSQSTAGVSTYNYDNAFRLTTFNYSLAGTASPQAIYSYDAANRLTTMVAGAAGGAQTNMNVAYDNASRVTTLLHYYSNIHAPTFVGLGTYVYAYDNANRVTTEQNAEGTATYTYDAINELTATGDERTENYSYDAGGNRNRTSSNLAAWYSNFNTGSGTTIADFSGNTNTGTLNGATYSSTTPFQTGYSLSFNRTNSNYVNLGSNSSIELTGPITLSAWVYITSAAQAGKLPRIISNLTGSNYNGFELLVHDTNPVSGVAYLQVGNNGTLQTVADTTALAVNQWVFLTATYDPLSGTAKFYHNGALVSTATGWGATAIGSSSEPVDIGTWPGDITSNYSFPGYIDDVRIYNSALSDAAVLNLYNNVNLAASYNFDEGGGTTAIDSSGNGNTGAIDGANYASNSPFQSGYSLSFNQADSNYVDLGDSSSIELTGSITLGAWVYITSSAQSGYFPVIISNLTNSNYNGFELLVHDSSGAAPGAVYLQVGNGGTLQTVYDTTALPVNQWVFVTATYNASTGTATFYHNGTSVSTASWGTTAIGASTEPVAIGTRPSDITSSLSFPGFIDNVFIYNTALSSTAVADLYNNANLVAYYNFNEGSGSTANDASGNGNNGTINGATYSAMTPFQSGYSLGFNGTSSNVNIGSGSDLNITGPITMSAWIKTSAFGGYYHIIGGYQPSSPYPGYGFLVGGIPGSTTDGHLAYWSGANGAWVEGHTAVNDGNWHFVAVTETGTSAQFYIDGVADGAAVTTSEPNSYTGSRTIGEGDAGYYWNGSLDDVRIYSAALSANAIANLYNNGPGYAVGAANEQTVSPGAVTYTYDNEGNIVTANNGTTTTYTYDYHNRLTQVNAGGTIVATYVYDAEDRRIGINDSGTQTWTVYDDASPYADFNSSAALTHYYVSGPNGLLARTDSSGNSYYYSADKLGTVRYISNTSGTVEDHVIYDSYGQVTSETNSSNGDRFKFAQLEYDSGTSLYYAQARYYSPAIGRFINRDPMGFDAGDPNLYRYVSNSPTNETDAGGTQDYPGSEIGPFATPNMNPKDRQGIEHSFECANICSLVGGIGGIMGGSIGMGTTTGLRNPALIPPGMVVGAGGGGFSGGLYGGQYGGALSEHNPGLPSGRELYNLFWDSFYVNYDAGLLMGTLYPEYGGSRPTMSSGSKPTLTRYGQQQKAQIESARAASEQFPPGYRVPPGDTAGALEESKEALGNIRSYVQKIQQQDANRSPPRPKPNPSPPPDDTGISTGNPYKTGTPPNYPPDWDPTRGAPPKITPIPINIRPPILGPKSPTVPPQTPSGPATRGPLPSPNAPGNTEVGGDPH